jgi:hypothetical protein
MTIECYIKCLDSRIGKILSTRNRVSNIEYGFELYQNYNQLGFTDCRNGGVSYNVTNYIDIWHHIAITIDTTVGYMKLWYDGVLVNTKSNYTINSPTYTTYKVLDVGVPKHGTYPLEPWSGSIKGLGINI